MADLAAPYITPVTPLDGAVDVGRATVFRIRFVDTKTGVDPNWGLDRTSLNVGILPTPATDIVLNGIVQAGDWSLTEVVNLDEGDDSILEVQLRNDSLLAYDATYTFTASVADDDGLVTTRELSYTTLEDPVYDGTEPTPLEMAMTTTFSTPFLEAFRAGVLAEFSSPKTDPHYGELAARRARQVMYRMRYEAVLATWWPDETSVWAGPVLNAVSTNTLIQRRATMRSLLTTVLRSTAHIVPEALQSPFHEAANRPTRPVLVHAAAVAYLGLLCKIRDNGLIS